MADIGRQKLRYNHTRPAPANHHSPQASRGDFTLSHSEPLITAENLGLEVAGRQLLHNITLELQRGEIVTVIGPNGAGKTTLLRLLLGLTRASSGAVWRRPGLRIGYMPQRLQIDPSMPMSVQRFLQLGQPHLSTQLAQSVLQRVGARELAQASLAELSGGEMQRVLLARAASRKPQLLVLDEPTQGVDVGGQGEVYRLIAALRDELGCGVLLVSHDLHLVMAATDKVLCINQHICCEGHPEQVRRDPAYLELFGDKVAPYTHQHNHEHNLSGDIVADHGCDHAPGHPHPHSDSKERK
ncbi:ATP-binding cassette domain-containing protein [Microbulbifer magnicolonia]|uniref:ATP-binding cassette domain-containing protein n=1 Tax=Microbulbifer magnicolonia TaxID=3109744 RepID=UPI002B4075F8|nr:ATP-binding cassette domain-containing protein [Microbulbifer sp. GG15]